MSAQHTPAPWKLKYEDCNHVIRMGDAIKSPHEHEVQNIIEYDHGLDRDDKRDRKSFLIAQANARLIAAAPDLLAALEAAVDAGIIPKSSALDGGAMRYSGQVHVADMCRAAIAKATGGAA